MKALSVPEASVLACIDTILTCDRRDAQSRECVTHHAHVEVNLVKRGLVTCLYGGNQIRVGAGRLVAFWSAIPHLVVSATSNAEYYAMTIPLTLFLQFSLPEGLTHLVLDGQVLVEPQTSPKGDFDMFERWIEDLRLRQSARQRIVLLEVEARLLRFAMELAAQNPLPTSRNNVPLTRDQNSLDRIRQMLFFIAQNYTDHITVERISQSVGFHPNYAMNLFRKTLGTSVVNYVTRLRVSHAQQLLATSGQKVVDVAMSSGFNSLSRFNDVFKEACGCSPREYRARCRSIGSNQGNSNSRIRCMERASLPSHPS